jgi:hypothetical protein
MHAQQCGRTQIRICHRQKQRVTRYMQPWLERPPARAGKRNEGPHIHPIVQPPIHSTEASQIPLVRKVESPKCMYV